MSKDVGNNNNKTEIKSNIENDITSVTQSKKSEIGSQRAKTNHILKNVEPNLTKRQKKIGEYFNSDNNWQPRIANLIAFFALVVSVILAIYTWKVFNLASAQSDSVKKSADAAVSAAKTDSETLAETKKYNKENSDRAETLYNESKRESIKRNKIDQDNNKQQKQLLDAQIANIKNVKRNFELENRPFIQLSNFAVDTFQVGKRLHLNFQIVNIGKFPGKILVIKTGIFIGNVKDPKTLLNRALQSNDTTISALNSSLTMSRTFQSYNKLTSYEYSLVKNKAEYLYFFTTVKYLSISNNKIYYAEFANKITGIPVFDVVTFINEDSEGKPKYFN